MPPKKSTEPPAGQRSIAAFFTKKSTPRAASASPSTSALASAATAASSSSSQVTDVITIASTPDAIEVASTPDDAPVRPPPTKRRRIVDSDDENDDDGGVKVVAVAAPSAVPEMTAAAAAAAGSVDRPASAAPSDIVMIERDTPPPPRQKKRRARENDDDDEDAEEEGGGDEREEAARDQGSDMDEDEDVEPPAVSEPATYADLCEMFEAVEKTTKRLEIASILTKFLIKIIKNSADDLLAIIYLCINRLGPEYEGLELGIGESILVKAIAEATGRTLQKIRADLGTVGDLGTVAQQSRGHQSTMFQPKPLQVPRVFKTLKEIAKITGGSSQKIKVDKIKTLLVSCRGNEAKFLVRSLEGKLRIGLAERTVLVALAHAFVYRKKKHPPDSDLKAAEETIKSVYSELPSYDLIVPALLKYPVKSLPDHCHLTPGIPLKPMLAHPTKAISEVLDRFEGKPFTCEFKYDGERAQIHLLESGKTLIYSRNSEKLSPKYPDVMGRLDKIGKEGTFSFVLDCEAVAWDREQQCILPFQVLSTRKRKDVTEASIKVQVCIFVFDLLYLNGESLLRHTLKARRALLLDHFSEIPGEFQFAKSMESRELDDIQAFLDDSVVGNCEGLMVKTLEDESSYEPSKRSRNWLKVKKDYLEGVGDSLDLVVIGGFTGKGKRTGVYGGFLLASYDPGNEEYQSICKIGTGFSEEMLAQLAEALKAHIIAAPRSYYNLGDAKADIWFDPVQVWEVKAADLSISPVYKSGVGLVDPNKGISLRFPRFIRIRDDKKPEDATTGEQVADMYQRQQINNAKQTKGGEDDEY
ncbi:DNA ligase I, ATP-dependent (dnl1) [Allomyces macrogynus ATCC 38327]|uniref:DNA ligase n=1 Tax=Allomyces macrogynus (strain ATCC 38327) TaxID=578462 RepID=A0A0L0S2U1_ALLM3|nr:DNA ligase I, ATP-dependent (dnl1) [Allomyces macrogynus ATCC 38327]|eukprot:KNE56721.1 DNA ligase I, ATP-dependent (dnl1) [Allomyces macrogynus ATCC 38327]